MKLNKLNAAKLDKCYSIAPLFYNGSRHILTAAEKKGTCLLFDEYGNLEETLEYGEGGTMTMVQIPGSNGWFLATHKFYSPNDSKKAELILVRPFGKNDWRKQTVASLPFVHRFDIVSRSGVDYLIACTLKTGHDFQDDWTKPGQVLVCELPEEIGHYNEENPLIFKPILTGLFKNHGYCRMKENGERFSVIGTDNGIFQIKPPLEKGGDWEITKLLDAPASDMAFADFDSDGQQEMIVISPFHGDDVKIYKLENGIYEPVYVHEEKLEFSHSIFAGMVYGKTFAIIGHRKGTRDLIEFYYEPSSKTYQTRILDHNIGSANVFHYQRGDKDCLVSANRETDEAAFYEFEIE